MGEKTISSRKHAGFENAFILVGGHGKFQWLCVAVCSVQLVMMTWNHLSYIFIGAVPQHWCDVEGIFTSTNWTVDQMKNISIPKKVLHDNNHYYTSADSDNSTLVTATTFKYEQCSYYNIPYERLLEESNGDFESAYGLVHGRSKDDDEDIAMSHYPLNVMMCDKWSYDQSIYKSTIVTEFDLVCEKRYLVASIQALYMFGAFMGTLVFGPINDKILGRRKTTLVSIVFVLIGGFLASFSVSYLMFIGMRFLIAIGTAGCMQAFSIWFLEHCDTQSRAKLYCISGLFFGVGYAIMPIFAYYIRDWSNLQLAFSVTTLSLISLFWILPESPRWLATNGQDEEAVEALLRIARINGMPAPNREDLLNIVRSCHNCEENADIADGAEHIVNAEGKDISLNDLENNVIPTDNTRTNSRGIARNRNKQSPTRIILQKSIVGVKNFKSLLSTSELRRTSFTVWALFVSVAFVYYGFAFSSSNILGSDPYLLVALGALMEVPASLLPIPFLSWWGRRPTILICYIVTGLSSLSIALTPADYEGTRTVLSMIGKLFVASAFTVLYLFVSEVYPTVVRSTGQGAGTLMGRVGSIAAPYVADLLTTVYPDLPSIIFGIVALAASLIALFIPEMKDVDMKDQLQ